MEGWLFMNAGWTCEVETFLSVWWPPRRVTSEDMHAFSPLPHAGFNGFHCLDMDGILFVEKRGVMLNSHPFLEVPCLVTSHS